MGPTDQQSNNNLAAPGIEGNWTSYVWARACAWRIVSDFFEAGDDPDDQLTALFDENACNAFAELDRLCDNYRLDGEFPGLKTAFRKLVEICSQNDMGQSANLLKACPDPKKAADTLAQMAQSAAKAKRLVAAGDNQMAEWTILLQSAMYSYEVEEEPNLPLPYGSVYHDLIVATRELVYALAVRDVQIARALAADFGK